VLDAGIHRVTITGAGCHPREHERPAAAAPPTVRVLIRPAAGITIAVIVLIFNAMLYVIALSLSLAIITPVPEDATRRVRVARWALAGGGGVTITVAIALSFMGLWFESGIVGAVAIVVVGAGMWVALTSSPADSDGDDGEDDGGGGQRKPKVPPAPPEPLGDRPYDPWVDFDRARAGWDRDREPLGV
jgi:hypothetical protein